MWYSVAMLPASSYRLLSASAWLNVANRSSFFKSWFCCCSAASAKFVTDFPSRKRQLCVPSFLSHVQLSPVGATAYRQHCDLMRSSIFGRTLYAKSVCWRYFETSSAKSPVTVSPKIPSSGLSKAPVSPSDVNNTSSKPLMQQVARVMHQLKQDRILTIPNVLTLLRMLMAPALGYLVYVNEYSAACCIFVVAGFTDLLDGFIARNVANQTSELGSFIDPLADKLLVSILFLSLTAVNLIPVALTSLVILRDVFLMAGGFYVRYISLPSPRTLKQYFDLSNPSARLQPTTISKINTVIQLSLVAVTLAAPVFDFVDHPALHGLWYVTAASTFISGIGYMFAKDTFRLLKQTHKNSP